ncbi:hypothetical protein [Nostoc sp.]|uniref:hypothetical protein n=1 Tax=Nostoc sp. TaxID=1180 RepID=UPI002FF819A2
MVLWVHWSVRMGGRAVRIAAIEQIGIVPAALTEDVVAIALPAFIVTRCCHVVRKS